MLYKISREKDKALFCRREEDTRSVLSGQVKELLFMMPFMWSWDIPDYCSRNGHALSLVVPKEFL